MNRKKCVFAVLTGLLFVTHTASAQDRKKTAQSGLQFLSIISDARSAALGGAVHTLPGMNSSALLFNPAGMADMEASIDITASQNQWIADISHNTFTIAFNPANGRYGVIGASLLIVDYGEFQGTMVAPDEFLGYIKTDIFSPSAFAAGLGYAKKLTDMFSVGGQIKYVRQTLGHSVYQVNDTLNAKVRNEVSTLAYDFGTMFKTGYKSLVFGMSVRNFAPELKYEREGFQAPMAFTLGISMDLVDIMPLDNATHSLYASVNHTYFRSHEGQIIIGLDYTLAGMLSIRSGYIFGNDEDNISFGMGVNVHGISFDYAYTPFGVFDKVQRMTARFSM
ncbi:PorV/PorQ family protein [bacterium]|nr:PorV/PorQ family protein [bacterium]